MAQCVEVFLNIILTRHTVPVHFLTPDRCFPLCLLTLLSPSQSGPLLWQWITALSYCREFAHLVSHRGLSGSSVTGVRSGLSVFRTSLLVSWIVRLCCVMVNSSHSDQRSRACTRPLKGSDCFCRTKFSFQTVAANVLVNDSESVLFEKR